MDIVLATLNAHKVKEFQSALAGLKMRIVPQSEFKVAEVAETGKTFVENAIIKARHAADFTKRPAIADDSGLVVPALDGAPGVYSARFAGEHATDVMNNQKLLDSMQNMTEDERDAYYYCVIVFMRDSDDPTPIICEGKWQGKILQSPRGNQGFGYDPLFYVLSERKTAAELTLYRKNELSHRGAALRAFTNYIRGQSL